MTTGSVDSPKSRPAVLRRWQAGPRSAQRLLRLSSDPFRRLPRPVDGRRPVEPRHRGAYARAWAWKHRPTRVLPLLCNVNGCGGGGQRGRPCWRLQVRPFQQASGTSISDTFYSSANLGLRLGSKRWMCQARLFAASESRHPCWSHESHPSLAWSQCARRGWCARWPSPARV